jgi:hypothetical protein
VPREALRVLVEDQPVPPVWEGEYLRFNGLAAGHSVRLEYPLVERTEQEQVAGEPLTVKWRGGTVIGVTPHGPGLDTYGGRQAATPRSIPRPAYPVNDRVDW